VSRAASPAEIAKAERMLADITAGRTMFTRSAAGEWMIVGPAADVIEGARLTVTKRDGSTTDVIVARLGAVGEKRGVAYQVATFTEAPAARPAADEPVTRAEALATSVQIDEILRLVAQRLRDGNTAGFMPVRSYTREQLAGWTRSAASSYITSLREDY
jgi:hypothetical protein